MLQFLRGEKMTGNEFLKSKREDYGYSIRQFASDIGVSPRTITYYESGEKSIGAMSINKCIYMFHTLGMSIYDFFNTFYPYKEVIDEEKERWRKDNPSVYNFGLLKKRLYLRLAQIRKRERLGEADLEELMEMYESFFKNDAISYLESNDISVMDYEKFVKPIYYKIKVKMNGLPVDEIGYSIVDALCRTDYELSDVAMMCDISKQHLNQCINGNFDFGAMHVYTALKLSYLLELDFEKIFVKKSIKNARS
ncbi:MAG: helix-turn-helix transcriptional regulator [Lachnospiraceae bacterium]|nr:helix-turn-helix transcriptional regulator [Lachnospiraceae bacterium]